MKVDDSHLTLIHVKNIAQVIKNIFHSREKRVQIKVKMKNYMKDGKIVKETERNI